MVRRRLQSFGYAFAGILTLLRTQANARIHALATAVVVLLGWRTGLTREEWLPLVSAIALVWVAEALNTGIEFLADAAVPDHHELIKHAKDVAAAGVLLAAVAALVTGGLVFGPHLF